MPVPTFTGLGPKPEYNDIVNKINTLVAELTNLMLNMDSLNVVELIADHISAGTITGSTIQSTDGAYPRIELSSTSNILSAEGSATSSISIHADLSGTPTLRFIDGSDVALMILATGVLGLTTLNNADITISPTGNTNIFAGTGKQVKFEDWDKIFSDGDSQTLQDALDSKQGTVSGGGSTITTSDLTANRGLISNGSGKVAVSATTSTEIGYVSGVTSAIQTQLDGKATVVSGGKKIQTGGTAAQSASGSVITVTVTFPNAFTSAPRVYLTLDDTNTSTIRVWHSNITTTQFTLYFSGSTGFSSCQWLAIGD